MDALLSKREMLDDYFQMIIDPDTLCLHTLPMIVEGYSPELSKLGIFLLQLALKACRIPYYCRFD